MKIGAQSPSDDRYKHAFVDFISSRPWHWFITIPIGGCQNDDVVRQRLRLIQARLCGKYLVNRYHKLPDEARFSFVVAFEGEITCGTRHAHVLVYVPPLFKKRPRISDAMLTCVLQQEFRFLWAAQRLCGSSQTDSNSDFWYKAMTELRIEPATFARSVYTVKKVRLQDVPWSRFEFVTPPKSKAFSNKTLSVIRNRNRQKRNFLKQNGDPLFCLSVT